MLGTNVLVFPNKVWGVPRDIEIFGVPKHTLLVIIMIQKYQVRIVAVEKPTHLKQVMPQRQQNVPEPPR